MEWSKASVDILIEAYSKEACLYNNKSPLYHNKRARQRALEKVCDALKEVRPSTIVEIISKMKSLRTTFVNEINKVIKSKMSGSEAEDIYQPTLWYFEKLMFLKDYVQPRKGISIADIHTSNGASQSTSEFSACEVVATLSDVPVVGDWELINPIPSISNCISDTPQQSNASPTLQNEPSSSGTSKSQKRKRLVEEKDRLIEEASEILSSVAKRQYSDLDAVGAFVTSSLKGLRSKALTIKGKRLIFDVILNLQEEDLANESE